MQKKWVRMVFRRRVTVIFLLLLQIAFMVAMIYSSSQTYRWVYNVLSVISLGVVLYVISSPSRALYKLLWSITILSFPLFGGLLYLMVRLQGFTMAFKKRLRLSEQSVTESFSTEPEILEQFSGQYPAYQHQAHYLTKQCGFRLYGNHSVSYLSPGEEKFSALLSALEEAEHFIFLEYFIIQEGKMWNSILDVLKRKAAEGVEVRLIYDDMGCFLLLPLDYKNYLEQCGIRCVVFNKFRPALSTLQNHRDHRKIAVIDGKWAFTGGINLADEYINETIRFGHWKDSSIRVTGESVNGFTLMFLTMWQALTGEKEDMGSYLQPKEAETENDGFIIPYSDSPIDSEYVGEQVYLNLINGARDYLYIMTPYLIIDDVLVSALILAAKNGVDVKILTPGMPDKQYVHMTTQSYYRELIFGGVEIYEYTPGFVHAKVMVADDTVATVGTVNLDCRSLYLHFECGAWLCGTCAISDIKEDFLKTLEKSKKIEDKDLKIGFIQRVLQSLFRLFAPLM